MIDENLQIVLTGSCVETRTPAMHVSANENPMRGVHSLLFSGLGSPQQFLPVGWFLLYFEIIFQYQPFPNSPFNKTPGAFLVAAFGFAPRCPLQCASDDNQSFISECKTFHLFAGIGHTG
jgi:hypothetical protein